MVKHENPPQPRIIEYTSPLSKRPYSSQEIGESAWSLSTVLLRPFQYLKCKSYGEQRKIQLRDDGTAHEQPAAQRLPQDVLTQSDLQDFWVKQRQFLDSVSKRFENTRRVQDVSKNESEFLDTTTNHGTHELGTLSTQLANMNQVTHQLQQTQQFIIAELEQKLAGNDLNEQEARALFSELEAKLSEQMQVYAEHLEKWKLETERNMNKMLHEQVKNQMENLVPVASLNDETVVSQQQDNTEQFEALSSLIDQLNQRVAQCETQHQSNKQFERIQDQMQQCTDRVHHTEDVLLSQTSLMKSMMNTASEKQESALRDVLARLDKLEHQQTTTTIVSRPTLQVPSMESEVKTRTRSRSETTTPALATPAARRQRSSTVTSATSRYKMDDNAQKNILSNLRKETIQQAQQITDLKKELKQMKKHMSTWRQENKTTKELVSKTKSQYEKLEGKMNVMSAKGKENLQLKGVSTAGVEFYEF